MAKVIILFVILLFASGCLVAHHRSTDGLLAETVSSSDGSVKGVIGKYYARLNYYDELSVDVMGFGLQERVVSQGKGWLTLVFRKDNKTATLWNDYFFDSSKLKIDIGELNLASSTPLNPGGYIFNVTGLLNSTPSGSLFITYDFTANEFYKPFGKLRFDGLMFNGDPVPALEVGISGQELEVKEKNKTCFSSQCSDWQ